MAHPLLLRDFPQTWTCYLHPLGVPTHLPCPIISAQSPRTLLEVTSQIVDYKLAIALKAKSLITGYTDIGGERANSYHVWFRKWLHCYVLLLNTSIWCPSVGHCTCTFMLALTLVRQASNFGVRRLG